jgi:hypothetical protein
MNSIVTRYLPALLLLVVSVSARAVDLSYKVVEQWSIPAGGFGRAIVVNRPSPTEAQLRALGDQLRKDTRGDKFAFVFVYDDERAARNRRLVASQELSGAELHHYEAHFFGSYIRSKRATGPP